MSDVIVFCYHRVNVLDKDSNYLAVSEENFEKHMIWLKDNFQLVRFEDDWRELDDDAVVITFDDGYEDYFTKAYPILERLNIPSTIFITTGTISNKNCIWSDELESLIYDTSIISEFVLDDEKYGYKWLTNSYEKKKEFYKAMHFLIKNYATEEMRRNWLSQLRSWSGVDVNKDRYRMLDENQIKEMSEKKLITIGAHTVNHPGLKYKSYEEQLFEIEYSISTLSNIVDKNIDILAFPFGQYGFDYDDIANKICKKLNIKKTAATLCGSWQPNDGDYNIHRNGVNNKNLDQFIDYVNNILLVR